MPTVLGYCYLKKNNVADDDLSDFSHLEVSLKAAFALGPPHSHWFCSPLQDDVWRCRWSVPRLALPRVPFDAGHEEDVGKGQAGHGGGHPKGHGVGGFVDVHPVPVLFDLQSSPMGTA